MMEKAFCIGVRETRGNIIKALNESGLPLDVIDMMLGEIKNVVHAQAEAEYQAELARAEDQGKEKKADKTEKPE